MNAYYSVGYQSEHINNMLMSQKLVASDHSSPETLRLCTGVVTLDKCSSNRNYMRKQFK